MNIPALIISLVLAFSATDVRFTIDLSFKSNPAALWQVGYSAGTTLAPDQFKLASYADTSGVIGVWHPTSDVGGYYPSVGQNRDNGPRESPAKTWALRPGQVAMEGSNAGQYSIVRFVVPADGTYTISATFEGVHYRLSTTDVHVLVNAKKMFSDQINGYGGDVSFHKIEGSKPKTSFSAEFGMTKNDIISFAVGYGANKTNVNDMTGLMVVIVKK